MPVDFGPFHAMSPLVEGILLGVKDQLASLSLINHPHQPHGNSRRYLQNSDFNFALCQITLTSRDQS